MKMNAQTTRAEPSFGFSIGLINSTSQRAVLTFLRLFRENMEWPLRRRLERSIAPRATIEP